MTTYTLARDDGWEIRFEIWFRFGNYTKVAYSDETKTGYSHHESESHIVVEELRDLYRASIENGYKLIDSYKVN